MESVAHRRWTYAEYLVQEAASDVKHEYFEGHILAMAGGSPDHAHLAASAIGVLTAQLRGRPCRVFSSDLRVRIPATGLATYPDVTVVCGRREADPEDPDTATNPTLIVEVLSPSSEKYDRGEKFAQYRTLPSLRDYLLIPQDRARIEHYSRNADGSWTFRACGPGESVVLDSLGGALSVDEVFAGAEFLEPRAEP